MGRWEPNAAGRLREAAMQLYLDRGYEQVTVADIAQRAGVTARTFFRYFADKREVLFAGSEALQQHLVAALEAAPSSATPMRAVRAAIDAVPQLIADREFSAQRNSVIAANVELRERELVKLASLSAALADALRRRGVADAEASLAAEAGIAVFRVAFERWVGGQDPRTFGEIIAESFDQLAALTARRTRRSA